MNGWWALIPAVGMYVVAICIAISAVLAVLEGRSDDPP